MSTTHSFPRRRPQRDPRAASGGSIPGPSWLPRIRSHALDAPSPAFVRQVLRATGVLDVEDVYGRACGEAGVSPLGDCRDLAELEAVVERLVLAGGHVGLAARAVAVRLRVYRELSEDSRQLPSPPWDWARLALDHLVRTRVPRPSRLEEVLALDPFAPELRPELDQAAARVAQRTGSPLAVVSVLLDGAQCVIGQVGVPEWVQRAGGLPSEWTFCATMQRTKQPYHVADAASDVMHRLSPAVMHDGAGSYAGAPLVTSRSEVIGSVCAIDVRPHAIGVDVVPFLESEARAVVGELERRRVELSAPV